MNCEITIRYALQFKLQGNFIFVPNLIGTLSIYSQGELNCPLCL
jgi:hypothetical protein